MSIAGESEGSAAANRLRKKEKKSKRIKEQIQKILVAPGRKKAGQNVVLVHSSHEGLLRFLNTTSEKWSSIDTVIGTPIMRA